MSRLPGSEKRDEAACQRKLGRRAFLGALGAGAAAVLLVLPLPGRAGQVTVERVPMARKKIGRLSALAVGEPVPFAYPDDGAYAAQCFLVRLGEEAGGGVGPDKDVVAFSAVCSHMGGPVSNVNRVHRVAGPCPFHLTTFDLTRFGMVVAGHATEALPQVAIEVEGDDVIAVGVQGLAYGRAGAFEPQRSQP